jgi:hypothetical protein
MNALQIPILISTLIFIIGVIGTTCALFAIRGVQKELNILKRVKIRLEDAESRNRLITLSSPSRWLEESGIETDCHVDDQLKTVWSGWRAQRLPTVGELHTLAVRRERSRFTGRVSGGIVACLLICGIAGTLLAVHPILSSFKIEIAADGSVQEASRSAQDVMSMVHGLSAAFWPSIAAMVSTLIVMLFRGCYLNKTNYLSRELERFACDDLFPLFRLPSLGDQMIDVKTRMTELANKLDARDKSFAAAVSTMNHIVAGIQESAPALAKAADNLSKASARLSSESNSINDGLERLLGKESSLVTSLKSVGTMVENGKSAANALRSISTLIEERLRDSSSTMLRTGEVLKSSAESVPGLIISSYQQGAATMTEHLQVMADKIVDQKLNQAELALKADYEKLCEKLSIVTEIVEGMPDRIEEKIETLSAQKPYSFFDQIRNSFRPKKGRQDSNIAVSHDSGVKETLD